MEERFKRVRVSAWSNFGHAQHASTVASNHVLREARTLHESLLTAQKKVKKKGEDAARNLGNAQEECICVQSAGF